MSTLLFMMLKFASGVDSHIWKNYSTCREIEPATFANTLWIAIQPANQFDCKGNKITFSVVAKDGVGTLHYLWKRKRPTDDQFTSFGAVDSTKLSVYNIGVGNEAPDGTLYQVTVTDQNSTVTSASAMLTVNQITGIAPVGVASYTISQGGYLWFKVLTSGNTPSGYQWIKKMGTNDWRDLADNSTVSGSQLAQINFTKISLADSGLYKLRVTYPTVNGDHCIETSTITRRIYVIPIPDSDPPVFLNLSDEHINLCPNDLEQANWDDTLSQILPIETDQWQLQKFNTQFNLSVSHFSDNVTPSADLILHWGIYLSGTPLTPIMDEAGSILDNRIGQISLHPENIDFVNPGSGSQAFQIIYWLEDAAHNVTPIDSRHKIELTILHRPEIKSGF